MIIFTEYFLFGMFSNAVWDLFFVENDMHKSHSSGEDKKEKNGGLNSTFFFLLMACVEILGSATGRRRSQAVNFTQPIHHEKRALTSFGLSTTIRVL